MQTATSTNIVSLRIEFSTRKNGHYDASFHLSGRAAPYRIPGHSYFSGHPPPRLLYLLRSHSKE
jgi:hypothetical protein